MQVLTQRLKRAKRLVGKVAFDSPPVIQSYLCEEAGAGREKASRVVPLQQAQVPSDLHYTACFETIRNKTLQSPAIKYLVEAEIRRFNANELWTIWHPLRSERNPQVTSKKGRIWLLQALTRKLKCAKRLISWLKNSYSISPLLTYMVISPHLDAEAGVGSEEANRPNTKAYGTLSNPQS